jgi:hypothetical protein
VHASYHNAAIERDEIVDGGVCAGGGPFVIQIKPKARPWGTVPPTPRDQQQHKKWKRDAASALIAHDAGKYSRKPMSV